MVLPGLWVLSFFSAPRSQTLAGMPEYCSPLLYDTAIHVRFLFARAGRMGGFPDLLSGMRVQGSVHGMQGVLEKQKLTGLSAFPCAGRL